MKHSNYYVYLNIKITVMKFIILAIMLSILKLTSYSQIQVRQSSPQVEVGKVSYMGNFHSELSYNVLDDDTTYTLMYRNSEFKTLVDVESIKFSSVGNTYNTLYDLIKSVYSPENVKNKDYKVEFRLGETEVIVSNVRMMGITTAMFFTTKGYFYITEKQLDRLFGKSTK